MLYDFRERAKLLGISPHEQFRGTMSVKNLERLVEILTDERNAAAIGEQLFDGIPEPEGDLGQIISRRVAAHVYSGRPLSSGDRALVDTAFPLDVNVISLPDKTISSEWNLNGLTPAGPVVVSIGTLTINDGGYITISNRALDLTIDTLVQNGTTRVPGRGDFNVLGAPGAAGAKGDAPAAPGQAASGQPGNCSSAGVAAGPGANGTHGDPGTTGGYGGDGKDGLPSLATIIRITKHIAAQRLISVLTMSGPGGKGGEGGQGSKGGQGGNGGAGAWCGCTGSVGGSGAQGGKGGTGGRGGTGGNGVDAQGNVFVLAPVALLDKFEQPPIKLPALPGEGGDPGLRGEGGAGGIGGAAGNHNNAGPAGGTGAVGEPGTRGSRGTSTGAPADVMFQKAR